MAGRLFFTSLALMTSTFALAHPQPIADVQDTEFPNIDIVNSVNTSVPITEPSTPPFTITGADSVTSYDHGECTATRVSERHVIVDFSAYIWCRKVDQGWKARGELKVKLYDNVGSGWVNHTGIRAADAETWSVCFWDRDCPVFVRWERA